MTTAMTFMRFMIFVSKGFPVIAILLSISERRKSATAPKIAWIPDSQEEPVGEAVVQYLKEQLGASVYRSAEDGDLTVRSDGERVWTAEE